MIFKVRMGQEELEIETSSDEPDERIDILGDTFTRAIVNSMVTTGATYGMYGHPINLSNLTNLDLSTVLTQENYEIVSTEPNLVSPDLPRGTMT